MGLYLSWSVNRNLGMELKLKVSAFLSIGSAEVDGFGFGLAVECGMEWNAISIIKFNSIHFLPFPFHLQSKPFPLKQTGSASKAS